MRIAYLALITGILLAPITDGQIKPERPPGELQLAVIEIGEVPTGTSAVKFRLSATIEDKTYCYLHVGKDLAFGSIVISDAQISKVADAFLNYTSPVEAVSRGENQIVRVELGDFEGSRVLWLKQGDKATPIVRDNAKTFGEALRRSEKYMAWIIERTAPLTSQ